MSTTVIELIALEIVRRLEEITTANDYSFDVVQVVRPDRLGQKYTPEDKLIEVTQGDSIKNEALSYPGNPPAVAYDVEFAINCFVRESDFNIVSYNTLQNERGAQIVKALTAEATDPSMWYTMGGNAIIAELGNIDSFDKGEGNHNGISVMLNVTYRTSETDPYTVRA